MCLVNYGGKEGLAECIIIGHNILGVYNCNVSFLKPLYFPHIFVSTTCSVMGTKERTINTGHQINIKILVRFWKTSLQALEMLRLLYIENTTSQTCLWVVEEVQREARRGNSWFKEREVLNQQINVERVK